MEDRGDRGRILRGPSGIDLIVWAEIDDVVYPRFVGIVDLIVDEFPDPGSDADHVTFTA